MIRRINLFGGPGIGKSVTAAKLFAELKIRNIHAELVREYIKTWAYQDRTPKSFDQYYIFGKQLWSEDVLLSNGVDIIITDSPLMMQIPYCFPEINSVSLKMMALDFEEKYPSINIFLSREGIEYQGEGRYHDYEQALKMDETIKDFLKKNDVQFSIHSAIDFELLLDNVLSKLGH